MPSTSLSNAKTLKWIRLIWIFTTYIIVFLVGLLFEFSNGNMKLISRSYYLLSFLLIVLSSNACFIDSKIKNRPICHGLQWQFFYCYYVSIPFYFFWSRGIARGIFYLIFHFFFLIVALISGKVLMGIYHIYK